MVAAAGRNEASVCNYVLSQPAVRAPGFGPRGPRGLGRERAQQLRSNTIMCCAFMCSAVRFPRHSFETHTFAKRWSACVD